MPSDKAKPRNDHEAAIIYQLEKIDQGGDITEMFESQIEHVANVFGLEVEEDAENPHCGDIKLPDGRYAALYFSAVVEDGC